MWSNCVERDHKKFDSKDFSAVKTFFFSFYNFSKGASASTKIKEVGIKFHIHISENIISEKKLSLRRWIKSSALLTCLPTIFALQGSRENFWLP